MRCSWTLFCYSIHDLIVTSDGLEPETSNRADSSQWEMMLHYKVMPSLIGWAQT